MARQEGITAQTARVWEGMVEHTGARRALLTVLILYPVVRVLIAARQGLGVSPDSVSYASAARSFAATGELVNYDGELLTIFPPGFPAVLGLLVRAGLDLEGGAVGVNALCVASSVLLIYRLATTVLRERGQGLITACAASVFGGTATVFSMLWSEPLFTVLSLLVLVLVGSGIAKGQLSWRRILIIATVTSAACSLRFVGFTIIPVVALGVLVTGREARGLAWGRSVLAGLLSSAGLLVVALRNVALGVPPLGAREPSGLSPFQVASESLTGLGAFIVPERWQGLSMAVGAGIAVILAAAVWEGLKGRDDATALLGIFVALWWVALLYSQFATVIDPVNVRLLTPAFGSMVVLVIGFMGRRVGRVVRGRQPHPVAGRRRGATLVVVAVWAGVFLASASATVTEWHSVLTAAREGVGFNRPEYRVSPLALAAGALPSDARIASNAAPWVAWVSNRKPVVPLPNGVSSSSSTTHRPEVRPVTERLRAGDLTHVVVLGDSQRVDVERELHAAGLALCPLVVNAEGAIFSATPC